jgi:hypothetical protein
MMLRDHRAAQNALPAATSLNKDKHERCEHIEASAEFEMPEF